MTRKIIQICVTGVENVQETQCNFVMTALCDDGTVWNRFGHSSNWLKIEAIPQDPKKDYPPPPPTTER